MLCVYICDGMIFVYDCVWLCVTGMSISDYMWFPVVVTAHVWFCIWDYVWLCDYVRLWTWLYNFVVYVFFSGYVQFYVFMCLRVYKGEAVLGYECICDYVWLYLVVCMAVYVWDSTCEIGGLSECGTLAGYVGLLHVCNYMCVTVSLIVHIRLPVSSAEAA